MLEACTILTLQDFYLYKVSTNLSNKGASNSIKSKRFAEAAPATATAAPSFSELLRTKQFFIEQQLFNKSAFFGSNFGEFNLPSDTLFAHFFISEFYFPEDCNYPVPSPQIFAHLSPALVNVDYLTLLWVNTLLLSLYHEKLIVIDQDKDLDSTKFEKVESLIEHVNMLTIFKQNS